MKIDQDNWNQSVEEKNKIKEELFLIDSSKYITETTISTIINSKRTIQLGYTILLINTFNGFIRNTLKPKL